MLGKEHGISDGVWPPAGQTSRGLLPRGRQLRLPTLWQLRVCRSTREHRLLSSPGLRVLSRILLCPAARAPPSGGERWPGLEPAQLVWLVRSGTSPASWLFRSRTSPASWLVRTGTSPASWLVRTGTSPASWLARIGTSPASWLTKVRFEKSWHSSC